MLASLADLGYEVEWRVVNAADYGFPQKRRRVFIIGRLGRVDRQPVRPAHPRRACSRGRCRSARRSHSIGRRSRSTATSRSSATPSTSGPSRLPFGNAGVMRISAGDRAAASGRPTSIAACDRRAPDARRHPRAADDVPAQFFVDERGPGEVAVPQGRQEPDAHQPSHRARSTPTTKGRSPSRTPSIGPSRTILTGEGGATPSRFKHLIQTEDGRFRRLTPARARATQRLPRRLDGRDVGRQACVHDGQRARRRARRADRRRARRRTWRSRDRHRPRPPLRRADGRACSSRIRRHRAQPSARSCAPTERATPGPSGAYARPFARPASAAIDSTGGRPPVGRTSPIPGRRSRSSSTAATGITARAATRTCRSPTRSSGRASSSSIANEMPGSACCSKQPVRTVLEQWECDLRNRLSECVHAITVDMATPPGRDRRPRSAP